MRDKFRNQMKKKGGGGYTEIPNCLLTEKDWMGLNAKHKHLLIALMARNFRDESFKVGIKALSKATGLGNATVIATTSELEKMKLLIVKRGPRNLRIPNEYDLTPFYEQFIKDQSPPIPEAPPKQVTKFELPDDVKKAIALDNKNSKA
jgi:hypothetical protein